MVLICEQCGKEIYNFFKIKEHYQDSHDNWKHRVIKKLCKECFKENDNQTPTA